MHRLLFVIALGFSQVGICQHTIVVESNTGERIPCATFEALSFPNSTHRIQKITDSQGQFSLNAADGMYVIKVRYFGFYSFLDTLDIASLKTVVLSKG